MKGKKHSAEQVIKKLREADAMIAAGKTVGQVAQNLEVSEQTLHGWRTKYGGMKSEERTSFDQKVARCRVPPK